MPLIIAVFASLLVTHTIPVSVLALVLVLHSAVSALNALPRFATFTLRSLPGGVHPPKPVTLVTLVDDLLACPRVDAAPARHSALNGEVTSARVTQIPALRELDLRGSRQITDASLALLLHALEQWNSGLQLGLQHLPPTFVKPPHSVVNLVYNLPHSDRVHALRSTSSDPNPKTSPSVQPFWPL